MSNIFFISDCHFNHSNIIRFCKRPFIQSGDLTPDGNWSSREIANNRKEEMNELIISNWNSKIKSNDHVYHIGDFCFGDPFPIVRRLAGHKHFLIGDHDKSILTNEKKLLDCDCYDFKYMERIKRGNIDITLLHWKMQVWPKSHFNSCHLYGHCLDLETEILTDSGWKKRPDLLITDRAMSLNLNNDTLEYVSIDNIIDYKDYSGLVYNIKSRGLDLRITDKHVLVDIVRKQNNTLYRKFYANDLCKVDRRVFIKAGNINNKGIDISDDFLRLMVWIAADGSLSNSSLVRIMIQKQRKIERLSLLLDRLNIDYRKHQQKDSRISFNFSIPKEISKYELKPITKEILLLNNNQLLVLIDEYTHTDGYKNGHSFLIYTSKKEEADRIQISCIQNNCSCNISERNHHGFSKKTNYELCITKKIYRIHANLSNHVKTEFVQSEHFWCVKNKNQTLFVRRNGKPIIVGNSHGRLPPTGKSWDVGVDNNNFSPLSLDEIISIMEKRPDNFNLVKNRHI